MGGSFNTTCISWGGEFRQVANPTKCFLFSIIVIFVDVIIDKYYLNGISFDLYPVKRKT